MNKVESIFLTFIFVFGGRVRFRASIICNAQYCLSLAYGRVTDFGIIKYVDLEMNREKNTNRIKILINLWNFTKVF